MKTRMKAKRALLALASAAALAVLAAAPAHASYTVQDTGDLLLLTGDNAADSLELRISADGQALIPVVNGNQIAAPLLSSFTQVQVRAGGGRDLVQMNDQNGALGTQKQVILLGQDGDDTLIGGGGKQIIDGGEDDDAIDGDNVTTNPQDSADDDLRGGSGNDTFRWNPRDEDDLFDGGANRDRIRAEGDGADDVFTVDPGIDGLRVRRTPGSALRPSGVPFRIAASTEELEIDGLGGADQFTVGDEVPASLAIDIDGGEGADVATGGIGDDTITGGPGVDQLKGRGGADRIVANDGDDLLDGGKGADSLDGGAGRDTFVCGAEVDTLVFERGIDVIGNDCEVPPADPEPGPGPVPEPTPDPGPVPHAGPVPDPRPAPDPISPPVQPPRSVLFATPKVSGSFRALTVKVRNTHTEAIRVKVTGSEKAGGRRFKHRGRTVLVAAGQTVKVTLKTPAALRRLLERAARKRGRVVRRPAITVATVDGAAKATVRPRLSLRVKRR
jgi:hypothetical protein